MNLSLSTNLLAPCKTTWFRFHKGFQPLRHKQRSFRKPQKALAFTFFDFHRKNTPGPRPTPFQVVFRQDRQTPFPAFDRPPQIHAWCSKVLIIDWIMWWGSRFIGDVGNFMCQRQPDNGEKYSTKLYDCSWLFGTNLLAYVVGIVYDNSFLVDSHSLGSILPTLI